MSKKYLKLHESEIPKISDKIKHFKWSAIGNLLFDIPGENKEFLDSDETVHNDKIGIIKSFWRHDTNTLMFDENDNLKRGKQDSLSVKLGALSRSIDTSLLADFTREVIQKGMLTADIISKFMKKVSGQYPKSEKKSGVLDVLGNALIDKEPILDKFKETRKVFNEQLCILPPEFSLNVELAR